MAKKLTEAEKQLITKLHISPYTVEFCEDWLKRPSYDIVTNAPCALQQLAVETFVDTVRKMVQISTPRMNEGYQIIDSVHVGEAEFVLGKLSSSTHEQYVTWQVKDETDYFWGHYFLTLPEAQEDLLARATECCNRKKDEQPDSVDAPQEIIVRLHDLYMESVVTNFKPLVDAVRNQEVVIYSLQMDEDSLTYGLDDEDAAKTLAEMESTRDRIANDPAFVAL